MIPKIIHYCWFGGNPIPEKDRKCIESWKKFCPDYEIREWTEKDFDFSTDFNTYTRDAYNAKAWGFVPDYIRLWIIYNYGGIYLDTDVEIIKNFDSLLTNEGFAGIETTEYVNFGLGFGAEKGNKLILEHMNIYNNISFVNTDGSYNKTPSPIYTTNVFEQNGLIKGLNKIQHINNLVIYPTEYFCPVDYYTGKKSITKNTYSIHWYNASWQSDEQKQWHIAFKKLSKVFGKKNSDIILGIYFSVKKEGIINYIIKRVRKKFNDNIRKQ